MTLNREDSGFVRGRRHCLPRRQARKIADDEGRIVGKCVGWRRWSARQKASARCANRRPRLPPLDIRARSQGEDEDSRATDRRAGGARRMWSVGAPREPPLLCACTISAAVTEVTSASRTAPCSSIAQILSVAGHGGPFRDESAPVSPRVQGLWPRSGDFLCTWRKRVSWLPRERRSDQAPRMPRYLWLGKGVGWVPR